MTSWASINRVSRDDLSAMYWRKNDRGKYVYSVTELADIVGVEARNVHRLVDDVEVTMVCRGFYWADGTGVAHMFPCPSGESFVKTAKSREEASNAFTCEKCVRRDIHQICASIGSP